MTGLHDPLRGIAHFDVPRATPTDELVDIAAAMRSAGIDALLIERRDAQLAVLTEYDIVTGVADGGHNTWATDVMSREVIDVAADLSVLDAVALMTDRGIRHLVVRDGARVGILCLSDCVPVLLAALGGGRDLAEENQ